MIYFLDGEVVAAKKNYVAIRVGGVAYKIYSLEKFNLSEKTKLYTYQYVKEDVLDLYGFRKESDLEVFEMMLAVSGVGPKMAMSITAGLGKDKIIQAISTGDTTLFRTVSGVGQKLAGKIIIELKNKIAKGDLPGSFFEGGDEVVEALKTFGLERKEILDILKQLPSEAKTTEDKIKFVLKNVKKNR